MTIDPAVSADQVLSGFDLTGKRALVTGVSGGIGAETARALVAHGAHVVGAARDLARAEAATHDVRGSASRLELLQLDLASLASVRAASAQLRTDRGRFDIVIANAGIMAVPFGRTADGFELQLGTNHLGHFAFVNGIASLMNDGARLVTLSTAGHRFSDVDLDDPNFDRTPYDAWTAYGRSKTANILFAVEFDRRYGHRGVRAVAVHPGAVDTGLSRHLSEEDMADLRERIKNLVPGTGGPPMSVKTAAQGAAAPIWAAVVADGADVGGRYCVDFHPAQVADGVGAHDTVRSYAVDSEHAQALWARSEEWVGERF